MQNDFISREATIAAITKRAGCFKKGPAKSAMEDAQIIIESVPAADVAPVVHAEWEKNIPPTISTGDMNAYYSVGFVCSVCGRGVLMEFNYCPFCGSRMDGGEPLRHRGDAFCSKRRKRQVKRKIADVQ